MHADMTGYCFGAPYLFDVAETGLLAAGKTTHAFCLDEHPCDHNVAAVAHPTALTVETVAKSRGKCNHRVHERSATYNLPFLHTQQSPFYFPVQVNSMVSANPSIVITLPSEIDSAFTPELRRAIEEDLSARKMTYCFQIFSGASHGFATRGDPAVESQRRCPVPSLNLSHGFFVSCVSCRLGKGGVR